MALTLEDVGRQCGVSRSTVSRVVNNSPLVKEWTKERVLKAIKELKYAPNFIARSLTKNCTETLAVTLPDITGGVFPEILAGMDEMASRRGYHLLVVFLGGARPKSSAVEQLISHRRVDAIMTVASTVDDDELIQLAEWDVPMVCVARKSPLKKIPCILFDGAGGAAEATRLLLARDRRRIVHIRGPRDNYDAEERARGFRNALKKAGVRSDAKREVEGNFKREGGIRAIQKIMDCGISFDAVFAGNDEMAIGAIEELQSRGKNVPREISVIGFDDIESARFVGLTTVRVPARELGRVAVRLAFEMLDGKKPIGFPILPTEIVERASTMTGDDAKTIRPKAIAYFPEELSAGEIRLSLERGTRMRYRS
jgi:LacI family transcriptional regulator